MSYNNFFTDIRITISENRSKFLILWDIYNLTFSNSTIFPLKIPEKTGKN